MTRAAVVITNHDYGRYVGAAIDSALTQTEPCHVVVVDNGSTDDSLAVIDRYRDRVTVLATGDGGQAAAFNAGFAATGEEIVLFLDADDRLAPDAVAAVVEAFDRDPVAVRCQFRLEWIDGDGRPLPGSFPEAGRLLPAGDLTEVLLHRPADIGWQPTSGNAFRATVLDELLPMPEEPYRISADHYLSNLSPLYGPVVAIDRTLGQYRVHGANADHRGRFDLERGRAILVRTAETHRALIDRAHRLGLTAPDTPDELRSLSEAALRLTSYRAEPRDRHPFDVDTLPALVRRGLRAAAGRSDLSPWRRLLAAAWILVLASVPRRFVGSVAGLALTR